MPTITNSVTGRHFTASPDVDLVTAALRCKEPIGYSCRQGICGSCSALIQSGTYSLIGSADRLTVLPGEVPHKVQLCKTIAHTDIVLEHTLVLESDRHAAVIDSIESMSDDIARVTLRFITAESFDFKPGQFIAIRWLGSKLKYFSIASAPNGDNTLELHVRKQADGGGFTKWLFDSATSSDVLGIEGPMGNFGWTTSPSRPVVLLATGTGFSPVKALIEGYQLWNHQAGVSFYWGGRLEADLYENAHAQHWTKRGAQLAYEPILSREADTWLGRTGRVPAAVLQDHPDLSGFDVYACGSPEMIAQAKRLFVKEGNLPEDRFFADVFESLERTPSLPVVSFNIEFSESHLQGRVYTEVGISLLEALRNNGLNLDHYCGGGAVCATCRINVDSTGQEPPEEEEADLLDCLEDLLNGDRLACQLTVTEAMANARIKLPGSPKNISRL